MISEAEALAGILARVNPLASARVTLAESIGRFSAKALTATTPLPVFDNSAMDGYALSLGDLSKGTQLRVTAEQPAGLDRRLEVKSGEAIRIFTGAPVPAGTAAVVMQEDVLREEDLIILSADSEPGEFIRRRGCDLAEGQQIVKPGQKITPPIAGLLASQGIAKVAVGGRARTALISTGDEVVPPGATPQAGQIFESNSTLVGGMLRQAGVAVTSAVHSPDDREKLRQAIDAAAGNDVLIITGGVSVGERDFVQEVLRAAGAKIEIWRVAIKPGKPFLFGWLGGCLVFGLPGNPVSAFVTFLKLVRPAILKLMGASLEDSALRRVHCKLSEDVSNHGDRTHYLRGRCESGHFVLISRQESHALFGLSQCNGLLRSEPASRLMAGASVEVELWE